MVKEIRCSFFHHIFKTTKKAVGKIKVLTQDAYECSALSQVTDKSVSFHCFITATDSFYLLSSFFDLALNRILKMFIKGDNHIRNEGSFRTLNNRNSPRTTVRAQYAKHNPPSHAMKAVCFQIQQTQEHSHCYPAPGTTVHKKGNDTLLKNFLL